MTTPKSKGYTTTADARKHLEKMKKANDERMVAELISNRKDTVKRTELELDELKKTLLETKKQTTEAITKAKAKDAGQELITAAETKANEVLKLEEKIQAAEAVIKQSKADIKRLSNDKTDGQ